MKNNNERFEELKEIAPKLASLEVCNSFDVPENYFAQLPMQLLHKIKEEELWEATPEPTLSPLLQSLKNKQSLSIPQNYFQTSAAQIINTIRSEQVTEETKAIAPTLASIAKQHALTVPQYYFSSLPQRVLQRAKQENTLNNLATSSFWEKLNNAIDNFLSPIFKPQLAFAFSLLFSVAVGIWFLQTGNKAEVNPVAALDNQLERVSTDEVNKYIAMHFDEFDEHSFKKKIGEINSVVIFDNQKIDEKKLEESILLELDEDMILELQQSKNKNSVI